MPLLARALLQSVISLAVIGAILCAAGGDWRWPQAWSFVGEVAVLSCAVVWWLDRRDRTLLEARLTSPVTKDQRRPDQILILAIGIVFIGWLVLMGLDHRFAWTSIPLWPEIVGAVLIAACMGLCWQTFQANSFAAPQVRVQAERVQTVIDSGPYRYIRHPMYAGALLFFIGAPLMLGSVWSLAGSAMLTALLALRTLGEEQVLKAGLPGYAGYMAKTPWRILPGVW